MKENQNFVLNFSLGTKKVLRILHLCMKNIYTTNQLVNHKSHET